MRNGDNVEQAEKSLLVWQLARAKIRNNVVQLASSDSKKILRYICAPVAIPDAICEVSALINLISKVNIRNQIDLISLVASLFKLLVTS